MKMMLFTAAVLPVLLTMAIANDSCQFFKTSSGKFTATFDCGYPWNVGKFCCGTCNDRYCCSDPQQKLSEAAQDDCFLGKLRDLAKPPPEFDDDVTVVISVTIGGLIVLCVLLLICWVCPCCFLYKKCRNPRPVMTTTTVVTTQHLPQQTVINRGRYPQYQRLLDNPDDGGHSSSPVPTGPYAGQSCVLGPPPPYQEAGAGYPGPNTQPPYIIDQVMYPVHPPAPSGFAHSRLPTDYTLPPAFNPTHVESTKTSY